MQLFELKVEVAVEAVETIEATLFELEATDWTMLEDAIARRAWIVGIFATEIEAGIRWQELQAALPVAVTTKPVGRSLADADWKNSYKIHFKAWKFGRLNWVPVWEQDSFRLPIGEEVLWLDPGMAFGTGNHETTRLVVERLVGFAERHHARARVVDAGAGSGILALSAAKLGFSTIDGFDNDPEAVRISKENADLNGLSGRVNFYVGDLVSGLANRQADLVMANIQADVLMRHVPQLCGAVAPGGMLVLSGILGSELPQVRSAFARWVGDWQVESQVLGEWSDLALTRLS